MIRCRICCLPVCYTKRKDNICRNTILPVVLCGCDTWSLTLTEERRLKVFKNRVLRRIFGSRSDEVKGEWRKVSKEEIFLSVIFMKYYSVLKSRKMRWVGHVARMGKRKVVYRILAGKLKEKRDHFEELGVNGRIIVKWISRTFLEGRH